MFLKVAKRLNGVLIRILSQTLKLNVPTIGQKNYSERISPKYSYLIDTRIYVIRYLHHVLYSAYTSSSYKVY